MHHGRGHSGIRLPQGLHWGLRKLEDKPESACKSLEAAIPMNASLGTGVMNRDMFRVRQRVVMRSQ